MTDKGEGANGGFSGFKGSPGRRRHGRGWGGNFQERDPKPLNNSKKKKMIIPGATTIASVIIIATIHRVFICPTLGSGF